jgi:glutamyl-tRNA synthetase/nondiscriminating glutamyl-tRNA synthetase
MFNFLAQMSWSPGPEERIYSVEEMIREFSLEKLSKGSPIFDMAKLDWLNSRLISAMTAEELFPHLEETLRNAGLWRESLTLESKPWFLRLIDLLKVRSRTIQELADSARPFLSDDFPLDPAGREKHLSDAGLRVLLSKLREDFIKIEDFSAANIEEALRGRSEAEGVKAALFIHALRLLAVGKTVSPGIFDVLALLGKGKTLERITYFLEENK